MTDGLAGSNPMSRMLPMGRPLPPGDRRRTADMLLTADSHRGSIVYDASSCPAAGGEDARRP